MLVLSRHEGEEVYFPELDITISVERIFNGRVQLGFDAPRQYKILRRELVEDATNEGEVGNVQISTGGRDEPGACDGPS